jgi:hypothetical protein
VTTNAYATNGSLKSETIEKRSNVAPPYDLSQKVRAWFELCGDPSPPSLEHLTQSPPNPLPTLSLDPIYEGGNQLTIKNVVNGAKVAVAKNGVPLGTWPCRGYALLLGGFGPFVTGDSFSATQSMCPGDPPSTPGDTTVQPCSALPAPKIGPVQGGDTQITLTHFVADAIISVYLNGVLVGKSGGPIVLLTKTVARGDTLHIIQSVGSCSGQYALEVKVACVDPPITYNPSAFNLFPVAWLEYAQGDRKGSVYYPSEDDGKGQPFHKRLASLGRVPIVFMLHGNHSAADPSYLGYDYFQNDLAKMGIIAVSVDSNVYNSSGAAEGHDVQNIENRANLLLDNIVYFQALDADPSSLFFGRIDFTRVGLMGHSRRGDAVVTAASAGMAGVTFRSVLALAPTNFRYWSGLSTIQPQGYVYQTLLPAGDGDVRDNNGAQFYDIASPGPFKSQLYVHYTNHNFFNRQWVYDDSLIFPQPAVLARYDHERILSGYGCALYRSTLLGHSTNRFLSGDERPAWVLSQHVYLSYEQTEVITVDNHEDGNTINKNSLGAATTQLSGMSADEFAFQQGAGSYNSSFYGQSTGMVARPGAPGRIFRSELSKPSDLSKSDIWLRSAEVTDGSSVPSDATGFKLGLEDKQGSQVWVDSDEVGGLPRPYARNPGMIKIMLSTLRFKGACFREQKFDLGSVVAVLIQCDRKDERALAFDDLQVVRR